MKRKWKPSKTAAREFAAEMEEIRQFCAENGIDMSASGDSFYFSHDGRKYRVSNHSVEASNRAAYDELTGEKRRGLYHEGGREDDVTYIHASKTRIRQIYSDICAGVTLDGRGFSKA